MEINFKQIKNNITKSPNRKIEYIILHDTANFRKGANAEMHFQYFNNANRNSSADFFIDDSQVFQINDYKNNFTWAVGDGKGRYGITNRNSVSIEICVNSDNDMEKTINKTVDLVIYLTKELNLPIDRVKRHFDASNKNCPQTMNMGNWNKWNEFINKVKERMNPMYKDKDKIAKWALPNVEKANELGLMIGDNEGNFNPKDEVTREQLATALVNLYNKLKG